MLQFLNLSEFMQEVSEAYLNLLDPLNAHVVLDDHLSQVTFGKKPLQSSFATRLLTGKEGKRVSWLEGQRQAVLPTIPRVTVKKKIYELWHNQFPIVHLHGQLPASGKEWSAPHHKASLVV